MKGKNITFNDLPDLMEAIITGQAQILSALENQKPQTTAVKEILSIKETSEMLGINRTTLWRYEKEGKLKSYGIDGRRYFKHSEIIASLTPLN